MRGTVIGIRDNPELLRSAEQKLGIRIEVLSGDMTPEARRASV